MASFLDYFSIRPITIWDIIDILIMWLIVYSLFKFMRGRRTMQIAVGLFALFTAQLLAQRFHLVVVNMTIGSMFNIIPVAIIVLFQDEIRRVLASIGTTSFFNRSATQNTVLDNAFNAAVTLSKSRIGALIVFEGEQGLRNYIEGGSRLDALPNTELLVDIFQPKSNLHDGAVIISGSRIASAACIMPLTRRRSVPTHLGTRHRAAIGISEEADCVALVVSEETSTISFAHGGEIYPASENTLIQLYETYNNLTQPQATEKKQILKSISRRTFRRAYLAKKVKSRIKQEGSK